jgi:hypothetical protein
MDLVSGLELCVVAYSLFYCLFVSQSELSELNGVGIPLCISLDRKRQRLRDLDTWAFKRERMDQSVSGQIPPMPSSPRAYRAESAPGTSDSGTAEFSVQSIFIILLPAYLSTPDLPPPLNSYPKNTSIDSDLVHMENTAAHYSSLFGSGSCRHVDLYTKVPNCIHHLYVLYCKYHQRQSLLKVPGSLSRRIVDAWRLWVH